MTKEQRIASFWKETFELNAMVDTLTIEEFLRKKIELSNKYIAMVEEEENYKHAMELVK